MRPINRIYILLTERCNMNCPHCYIAAGARESQGEMSFEKYKETLEQLRPHGLRHVKLTGGEPMIRRDVLRGIMEYCQKKNLSLALETNATLLNEDDLSFLLQFKGLEISISLDYPDERYDEFRGTPGAFAKVVNHVKTFVRNGVTPHILTTIFRENLREMEAIADFIVRELGTDLKFAPCMLLGRAKEGSFGQNVLTPEELIQFYHQIHTVAQKYPQRIMGMIPYIFHRGDSPLKISSCQPQNLIGLMPDGSVSLCGIGVTKKEAIWGNVHTDDIVTIVERSEELIHQFAVARYSGVCQRCIFIKSCANICPAHAYEMQGEFTASYPVCQIVFDHGLFPEEFLIDA